MYGITLCYGAKIRTERWETKWPHKTIQLRFYSILLDLTFKARSFQTHDNLVLLVIKNTSISGFTFSFFSHAGCIRSILCSDRQKDIFRKIVAKIIYNGNKQQSNKRLIPQGLTHNTSGHFAHCATRKILQVTFVKPPNKVS